MSEWKPFGVSWRRRLRQVRRALRISRFNPLPSLRRWWRLSMRRRPLDDLRPYEQRVFSQQGEDGVLAALFQVIGTTTRFYVEFGVEDGSQRNTRYLAERRGWRGLLVDGAFENPTINLRRDFVTAENINQIFAKYDVPEEFDLLSIDIDGNDYWVWRRLSGAYRPRVVMVEYNASVGPHERRTIAYDPAFVWSGTDYFGASLAALEQLGASKGYRLLGCESTGVNAFFVRSDLLGERLVPKTAREAYQPPLYGRAEGGHPRDPARTMMEVPAE
jgi:hypothetical protein